MSHFVKINETIVKIRCDWIPVTKQMIRLQRSCGGLCGRIIRHSVETVCHLKEEEWFWFPVSDKPHHQPLIDTSLFYRMWPVLVPAQINTDIDNRVPGSVAVETESVSLNSFLFRTRRESQLWTTSSFFCFLLWCQSTSCLQSWRDHQLLRWFGRTHGRSFPPVTMSPSLRVVYMVKTGPLCAFATTRTRKCSLHTNTSPFMAPVKVRLFWIRKIPTCI